MRRADRAQRLSAWVSVALMAVVLGCVAFTGIHWASMPPSTGAPGLGYTRAVIPRVAFTIGTARQIGRAPLLFAGLRRVHGSTVCGYDHVPGTPWNSL